MRRHLGFADTGAMWRSKYDMPPDAFARDLTRLWEQLRPLYVSLHAYVRWKLRDTYGDAIPANGPLPAHLLGNLWAQDWSNVYPLVAPAAADPGYSLTKRLQTRDVDPREASTDIGLLLQRALGRLAFLPFGLVVDTWRWDVFAGDVTPDEYNASWWDLKLKYQGVAPPTSRSDRQFDPGAKYHVPANTPYARYFIAHILQFQFHRALSQLAGCSGPLHRCSLFGSREAGRRLQTMMSLGQSRPWPEALEIVTGRREMDASAMVEYFAPLQRWLDEQNRGKPLGW